MPDSGSIAPRLQVTDTTGELQQYRRQFNARVRRTCELAGLTPVPEIEGGRTSSSRAMNTPADYDPKVCRGLHDG
jgi:hypothetical protein